MTDNRLKKLDHLFVYSVFRIDFNNMSKCKLKSKEGKSLRSKCIKKSVIRNSYVTEQLMGMFCQLCLEVIDDTS